MSNAAAAQWVKFFNASGIPSPAAASYAHIFVENRIQIDMLMDLNKEYLREMGITPMGDIIAILRHAKHVNDQTARDKVLTNSDVCVVPVAAVPANPHSSQERPSTTTKVKLKSVPVISSTSSKVSSRAVLKSTVSDKETPVSKTIRRVLPEHEGKYKIKLPSGSTKRSKEILAKRDKLYSDRENKQRTPVFERLTSSTIDLAKDDTDDGEASSESCRSVASCNEVETSMTNVRVHITGIGGPTSKKILSGGSSIFSRLGGKANVDSDDDLIDIDAKQIKPILKNIKKPECRSAIVKAKTVASSVRVPPQKQKVILVKKVPLRTTDSDEFDGNNDSMHSDIDIEMDDAAVVTSSNAVSSSEKIVKFASTAEVHEIVEPRFKKSPNARNYKGGVGNAAANVKSRLGTNSILHATKKTYNLKKAASNKNTKSVISPVKVKSIRLKSDELLLREEVPVHRRLGYRKGEAAETKSMATLANRVRKVNISNKNQASKAARKFQHNTNSGSVFDRLGFSK